MKTAEHTLHKVGIGAIVIVMSWSAGASAAEPIRVCATTPDLASIAEAIGGERVEVTTFTKGPQDPHYLEARPSLIRLLSRAEVYLRVGLELEDGWSPVLVRSARNSKVLRGGSGDVDVSAAIQPLEVPTAPIDRSMGDLHALGNPHYLLDPLRGLRVARLVRDRFGQLRPELRAEFDRRYEKFRTDMMARLFGAKLLEAYPAKSRTKLLELLERGGIRKFLAFIDGQGQRELLGGWLGRLAPFVGAKVVADHKLWPYFAQRFGFRVIDYLEPKPGISPTTKHLAELIRRMKAEGVSVVLASPYFDPRHARFVARHTQARIAEVAHQTGGRDGAATYLLMVDHNVEQVARALEGRS